MGSISCTPFTRSSECCIALTRICTYVNDCPYIVRFKMEFNRRGLHRAAPIAGSGLERNQMCSSGLPEVPAFPHPCLMVPSLQVEEVIMSNLERLAEEGFTDTAVEAAINTIEFSLRENNTGSFPRGLSLMLRAMSSWIYDQDPFQPLQWTKELEHFKVLYNPSRALPRTGIRRLPALAHEASQIGICLRAICETPRGCGGCVCNYYGSCQTDGLALQSLQWYLREGESYKMVHCRGGCRLGKMCLGRCCATSCWRTSTGLRWRCCRTQGWPRRRRPSSASGWRLCVRQWAPRTSNPSSARPRS